MYKREKKSNIVDISIIDDILCAEINYVRSGWNERCRLRRTAIKIGKIVSAFHFLCH